MIERIVRLLLFACLLWRSCLAWTTSSTTTTNIGRRRRSFYRPWTAPSSSSSLKTSNKIFVSRKHSQTENDVATNNTPTLSDRRRSLGLLSSAAVFLSVGTTSNTAVALAADDSSLLFTRREAGQFAYQFQPPKNCQAGNKPLKTHLDEINFVSDTTSGYQYGITVDPVRIGSLQEFGSPEQVAAKVVLAEVNRDGVFDVKLMEDPIGKREKDDDCEYYLLNYRSTGKRGVKRFVAKFLIRDGKLYALTAQCNEDDYATSLEAEMKQAVKSFRAIS